MSAEQPDRISFSRVEAVPTERDRYWAQQARTAWLRSAERLDKEARRWVAALAGFLSLFGLTYAVVPTTIPHGTWQALVAVVGATTAGLAAAIALLIAYAVAFPAPVQKWPTGDALRRHASDRADLIAKRLPWVRGLTGAAIAAAVTASLVPAVFPVIEVDPERFVSYEDGPTSVCGRLTSGPGVLTIDSGSELVILPADHATRLNIVESCESDG